jgi:HPt (histidine-containing phosphotransfer) domain-containing protein
MMYSERGGGGLDLEVALAYVEGDLRLLAELSALFLQDYPRLLEEIRNSLLQNDYSGLERAAHTLKGRLAFFGVHRAHRQVLELENMGRSNDLTRAGQTLTEVESEMEGLLPEFESLTRKQGA